MVHTYSQLLKVHSAAHIISLKTQSLPLLLETPLKLQRKSGSNLSSVPKISLFRKAWLALTAVTLGSIYHPLYRVLAAHYMEIASIPRVSMWLIARGEII